MIRFLQTPGKTKKIVLGGLLLIICGAMVVTLVPGGILGDAFGFGNLEKGVLAKVGNEDVTSTEVDQTARRIGRQQFGGRSLPSQFLPFLRQNAAQQLILQKAEIFEAGRLGLKVTDAELRDELQHGQLAQMFFPNGQFIGQAAYENFVQSQNMTVPQFEELLKAELLRNKLQTAVVAPVTVSQGNIEQEFKRQNTKVKFEYAVITPEDLMKQVHPTESELKAFYESHKKQYENSIPEKRQVRYVLTDTPTMEKKVEVTQQDLQRYYNEHQDEYRVADQVLVRHILIKTPLPGPDGKVDPKGAEEARKKAQSILDQLKKGGNFAELAKKYSQDPDSAKDGGSLGWIGRGRIPEFEKTVFSLKPGQTSDLVQSSSGFHIIHVDDKQQAHLKTLNEVKSEIEPIIRRQKAQAAADRLSSQLQGKARSLGLEKAAQDAGLQVVTSGYVNRTDTLPGLGAAPDFMTAVFASNVKAPPETVQTAQGYVVYQVIDSKPPATPTFEEARSRVESDYKSDRVNTMLGQKVQELADRAHAEHDLKKAAQQVGATLKTSDLVTMNSQVPDLGSMSGDASAVFSLKQGEISNPIRTGRGWAVVTLLEKQEPPASDLAQNSERLREELLQRKRDEALQLFVTGLRERLEKEGKIRINKDEWNRLTTATPESGD